MLEDDVTSHYDRAKFHHNMIDHNVTSPHYRTQWGRTLHLRDL